MNLFVPFGANTVLASPQGTVIVSYDNNMNIDVSLTAFLLTSENRVLNDDDIIFYNQPKSVSGAAILESIETIGHTKVHKLHFDLTKVPNYITKIAVTLTEDNGTGFANVNQLKATIVTPNDLIELMPSSFTEENGIVVLELYLRNNEAKVKSIWQGFFSGLEGLCQHYGVEVEPSITAPPPPQKPFIQLEKVTGQVNLVKGQKSVIIEKAPEITATVSWKSGTDYDIYALVFTKDGRQIDVATFGAKGVPPLINYGNGVVQHMGDIGRNQRKIKTEVMKLRLNSDILAVVPVVYSAQSNGTGSFSRYKVSMSIDNHRGTSVTISADNANKNDRIYTCVPGILHNTDEGIIITPLELYSKPNSEFRPKLQLGKNSLVEVLMDLGPKNNYK